MGPSPDSFGLRAVQQAQGYFGFDTGQPHGPLLRGPVTVFERWQGEQQVMIIQQIDQIRSSPLAAVGFAAANLSDASPRARQLALDIGSAADGLLIAGVGLRGGGVPPFAPGQTKLSVEADLKLKYMPKWTVEERAAANLKVGVLDFSNTNATPVARNGLSARLMFTKENGPVPKGQDIDHLIDLQLGGTNKMQNLWPLEASVNRSLGAQIQNQIQGLPPGTQINRVTIGD